MSNSEENNGKPAGAAEEDAVLVRAFQAGDRTAFDRLVLRHKDNLFNTLYWHLGDYQQANDAAQDVFVKVFRGLNRFRFESTFSTWLYRIAVNTCRNRLQSAAHRWRKRTVSLEDPGGAGDRNPGLQVPDGGPSPANGVERKQRRALIRRAVAELPGEQNRVVVLRDIRGLSYEEISEITGVNLGTVKSRLARARQELRIRLEGKI
ncbi:MAG: sigma-70 family RNA polymerase sigma factor [Deltaproteobacteria bacterium]|nr:sigma-70 family RNA polymerase sigma factor [Deltaproteobacteria bacterium]